MRTTGAGQSARLLLDVVSVLIQEKVDYAVIGAMAASVHGVVRASLDADAVLPLSPEQLKGLQSKFTLVGFQSEFRRGDPDDPIAAMLTLTDGYGNSVDLVVGLRGMDGGTFLRSFEVPFQGESLRIAGREDFIAMKIFAGGPLDLDDARRAIAVAGESLDLALLQRLTERYGSTAVSALQKLLAHQ